MKSWAFILFAALMYPYCAQAAVGTITEQVNAPPSIQRDKQTLTGAKGSGVEMNDAVRTTGGKVGITFEDNTRVQVTENSKVVIDEFVYDPKKGSGKLSINMAMGTVRYASGAIAHNNPSNVAINTPTATISVRGTDFTGTVDELGSSTFILLPSCPNDNKIRMPGDDVTNCKVGEIVVSTDQGVVILNQAWQATVVTSRNQPPSPPKLVHLGLDHINNWLIVSPPPELRQEGMNDRSVRRPYDFLNQHFLGPVAEIGNVLEQQQAQFFRNSLQKNSLEQSFLANQFEVMGNALSENLLDNKHSILPDYRKSSGVEVVMDSTAVQLCLKDAAGNNQCVQTPKDQNSQLIQSQGNVTIKNRVNQGGNTNITLKQSN
jgi:hypothetical protein